MALYAYNSRFTHSAIAQLGAREDVIPILSGTSDCIRIPSDGSDCREGGEVSGAAQV